MTTPPSPTPVVALDQVRVVRSGNVILDDVTWRILPGERWVLFGANGSGKTTLIDVVSTYLFPTSGTATVLGSTFGKADVRPLRSRIGYVGPAPTSLVRSHLRAHDIVVTGLHASFVATRWHTYTPQNWERAEDLLRSLHAAHLSDRQFGTLSEGEKKRVLIARSLMPQPNLLLLDEPGAGLDLGARERLVTSLGALAGEPGTPPAVLVTHHVEDIPPGFDHMLVLANGRVVAVGPLSEVLTSQSLSAAFGMDLCVARDGDRWRAWAGTPG